MEVGRVIHERLRRVAREEIARTATKNLCLDFS